MEKETTNKNCYNIKQEIDFQEDVFLSVLRV